MTKILKKLFFGLLLLLFICGFAGWYVFFKPNVQTSRMKSNWFFIPTGADFKTVSGPLMEGVIRNKMTFNMASRLLGYEENVKAGRYSLSPGMNNFELVKLLRSGRQIPIRLVIPPLRSVEQVASRAGALLETDSAGIMDFILSENYLKRKGLNHELAPALIIPNTYEFYWNTSAEGFVKRLDREYDRFWNHSRLESAKTLKLTPFEVSILASIVEKETNQQSEKAIIAGVYLNRLKKGWKLDADPTLVFASRDFNTRRVTGVHKSVDSPYNTYLYGGLPPGPICIPSQESIDAVLNAAEHDYMFFCAKEDFSGYHNFAETYAQQQINANKFRKALNKRNIR